MALDAFVEGKHNCMRCAESVAEQQKLLYLSRIAVGVLQWPKRIAEVQRSTAEEIIKHRHLSLALPQPKLAALQDRHIAVNKRSAFSWQICSRQAVRAMGL